MKDKTTAGILAILLGGLGIHHFYLGNMQMGIIYILLACVGISPVLGLVDGILYLTKSDEEFQANYTNWFCSGNKPPAPPAACCGRAGSPCP